MRILRAAVGGVTVALVTTACATRGRPPGDATALAAADALIRQGCYRCLEEAIDRLETHARVSPRHNRRRDELTIEALVLQGLRAHELGMPPSGVLARAGGLVSGLPSIAGDLPWRAATELADVLVNTDDASSYEARRFSYREGRARATQLVSELAPFVPRWRLGTVLTLTADCQDRAARDAIDWASVSGAHPGVDLLTYVEAGCGPDGDAAAASLGASDARWFEVAWLQGRRTLATTGDVRHAASLFEGAAAGLPDAGEVLLSLAGARQALRQLEPALATYNRLLTLSPDHRPALLGRVVCLTYLGRHAEAVSGATRLIELGTFLQGDAHYWRAWNRYQLKALGDADADAERALQLMSNTNVYTLAGIIRFDLGRLDDALSRLTRARDLDGRNCQAVWYTGLVHATREDWLAGGPMFAEAASCFTRAAAEARAMIDDVERSADPADTKAARTAEARTTLAESELGAARSAYNAAECLRRTGDIAAALAHLTTAAAHPDMRERAERLKGALKR